MTVGSRSPTAICNVLHRPRADAHPTPACAIQNFRGQGVRERDRAVSACPGAGVRRYNRLRNATCRRRGMRPVCGADAGCRPGLSSAKSVVRPLPSGRRAPLPAPEMSTICRLRSAAGRWCRCRRARSAIFRAGGGGNCRNPSIGAICREGRVRRSRRRAQKRQELRRSILRRRNRSSRKVP